ncbi:MAG TPA: DUF983 domain-containing protein [Chloroflexota bacterium]|nr:DUF983 domain-containing protein [Chloroflexota bacterium]
MPRARDRLVAMARQRCPRCLKGRVFRRGLSMYYACPERRVIYGRESGYFTGAMIVSYVLAVPVLALLCVLIWLATGWRAEFVILVGGLLFLPIVPPLFRYSRVIWMHFDRMVDPSLESERYAPPRPNR